MATESDTASPHSDEPPWRLWMAPAALVTGLAGGVFAASIVAVIGHSAGSSLSHPTPAVSLTGDLVFDLAFVGAALYFSAVRGRPKPSDFGFTRVSLKRGAGAVA